MVTGMRRIALWFLSTVAGVVLLFGYHTSTSGPAPVAGDTVAAAPAAPQTTPPTTGSPCTGSVADTRWGPVQVQITVANGTITDVTVLQAPDSNGKDRQINAEALPILKRATLTAQSADIDMVSGATVTSTGYVQSLQSALDQANLT